MLLVVSKLPSHEWSCWTNRIKRIITMWSLWGWSPSWRPTRHCSWSSTRRRSRRGSRSTIRGWLGRIRLASNAIQINTNINQIYSEKSVCIISLAPISISNEFNFNFVIIQSCDARCPWLLFWFPVFRNARHDTRMLPRNFIADRWSNVNTTKTDTNNHIKQNWQTIQLNDVWTASRSWYIWTIISSNYFYPIYFYSYEPTFSSFASDSMDERVASGRQTNGTNYTVRAIRFCLPNSFLTSFGQT